MNTYLHCDPIKGESTEENHKDWIEVFSFSHGLSQPMSGARGARGRSSARADFSPFVISKSIDIASVDLNMYCANGTHIAKVELEICHESGERICYLKYELENVIIQSVSVNGDDSDRPTETVAFVYDKISWTYIPVNNDGKAGNVVGPKKWNLEINKAE